VSDEVYHPIYHGRQTESAARLPHATVIADLSKAFSIAGVRTGWMIEHDAQRRQQYWNARAYFSICNSTTGEIFWEIANPQTRRRARQDPGSRHPKPQAPRALHGGPSRRTRLNSAARRHDRFPLAGERRERPPVLPGGHRARNPAGSRRLLRCALAFPLGFCRRRRRFLQGARPLRSIRKELVDEDGPSMTGTCCNTINRA
jgi:hypothetical protein